MSTETSYTETEYRKIEDDISLKMKSLKKRGVCKPRILRVGETEDLKDLKVEIGGHKDGNERYSEIYQFSPSKYGFVSLRDFKIYVKGMGHLSL